MKLRVECYAGRKADERPIRFELDGHRYLVQEVLDQWYGPKRTFFKVRADDGGLYILSHQMYMTTRMSGPLNPSGRCRVSADLRLSCTGFPDQDGPSREPGGHAQPLSTPFKTRGFVDPRITKPTGICAHDSWGVCYGSGAKEITESLYAESNASLVSRIRAARRVVTGRSPSGVAASPPINVEGPGVTLESLEGA